MLGFYNYTVILTYIGTMISAIGITFVMRGNIYASLGCLMISGLCDMFDGKIASTKTDRSRKEKRFGIQIDSLSDLICFGVLPAMIIYQTADRSIVSICVSSMYLLCALIRLAYFNVEEEERQNQTLEMRKVYLGLPVTTVALILPILIYLGVLWKWPMKMIGPVVLAQIGIGFITPFPIKKPGMSGKVLLVILGLAEFLLVMVR